MDVWNPRWHDTWQITNIMAFMYQKQGGIVNQCAFKMHTGADDYDASNGQPQPHQQLKHEGSHKLMWMPRKLLKSAGTTAWP
jgi:hypothetical protein